MKTIILISKETFNKFKEHATHAKPNDYYEQAHSNSARYIDFQSEPNQFPLEHLSINLGQADQYTKYWFLGRLGYLVDDTHQIYAYRTAGGNAWGVYQKDGKHFAFFDGRRSRAKDLAEFLTDDEINSKPLVYISSAPDDMKWFETQAEYFVKKGEKYTAKFLAEKCGGVPQHDLHNVNLCDAFAYFVRRNPNFGQLIHAELFKNKSPEAFLLREYRNKKINPETLKGKDKTAWALLPQATQDRILRWQ